MNVRYVISKYGILYVFICSVGQRVKHGGGGDE